MSMVTAWALYPLVLLALCVGLGLLVDVLCDRRLPGVLIPPTGFAAIVVVGQFTTLTDATAEITVPVLLALAVAGAGLSLPWRFGRPGCWPAAAALGAFAVFGAPVVLSGEATFAGYVKLDDTATWLALTDRAMEHGRSLEGLEPSTYRATLELNLGSGYPIGVFLPFGAAAKLVGTDLAWVFQPYVAFLAALLALALWEVLGGVTRSHGLRALAAFLGAQPALLFGYALWGGVKEVATSVLVVLAAALAAWLVAHRDAPGPGRGAARAGARSRDLLPAALTAVGLAGVLGFGGLVWLGPMALAVAPLLVRQLGVWRFLDLALAFVLLVGLFGLPLILGGSFSPFQSALTEERELGNLIEPLSPLQALGVWPAGDFRVDPDGSVVTAVLVALGGFAALLGLWAAWRLRAASLLLLSGALVAGIAVVLVGSPWVDGKALATMAPVLLTLALAGAVAALRLDRPTGVVLLVAISGGVLWSNVLAYGAADLAPRDQLEELEQIGTEFAGQGPALMTEYNPYGARHFLREMDAEGASELRARPVNLRDGGTPQKGEAVDLDRIVDDALLEYRTLVLRRSPTRSRPPSAYRLLWSGDHYEVWQRPLQSSGPPPVRLPLGEGLEPAAVPDCFEVRGLGLLALQRGMPEARLLAARDPGALDASDGVLRVPRTGAYEAWLLGSVRGAADLYVDRRRVGGARHFLNNEGGFVPLGTFRLRRGQHRVRLELNGADLHPGSGGFPRPATGPLIFSPAGAAPGRLLAAPLAQAESLCGRPWDWIEVIGGS